MKKDQTSITRPSNTTAYTIGDVIADDTAAVFQFDLAYMDNVATLIHTATMHVSTDEATALDATLLLFSAAPTIAADNSPCSITDAQFLNFLGSINFAAGDVEKCITGAVYTKTPDLLVKPAGDSTIIYGVLIAGNAYTPASEAVITISLSARTPT
jgi:hypothetical protein